ncbi:MAG: nickel pincer cofactor biosynthesis protein LarC [Desulfobacula sp.]|nr:nickel pincer cofactor biosynthesis protein LarC [Desulfobacula sp.]
MIAYVDMFSGISGDMMLGALVDLGVPVDWLTEKLSPVLTGFELKTDTVFRHHLRAVNLTVETREGRGISRNYKDIRAIIEKADLPEKVKANCLQAFQKIAAAESGIHGHDMDTIHFHEIGGIDSLVDIVGTFLAVDYLGIDRVYASAVPLGSGVVQCAHGILPVPVPAVLSILKDTPVKASDARTEIVTPTGAALITTLAAAFGPMPEMKIQKTGYGAGKRETGSSLPNLLRIILGEKTEAADTSGIQKETVQVIKTNIDDMSPEISGHLMDLLLENQALDVCFTPVQMKKNRPGVQVEVLCRKEYLDALIRLILTETSSIGVRVREWDRFFLLREPAEIRTSLGIIQAKKITGPDHRVRFVPEYEAVKKAALENRLPLQEVFNRVLVDINLTGKDTEDR